MEAAANIEAQDMEVQNMNVQDISDFQKTTAKQQLEQLYWRYEKPMYFLAYDILGNVSQAEDTVHEAFLKVIPYLEQLEQEDEAGVKAFMLRLSKSAAIDLYRKNKRESDFYKSESSNQGSEDYNQIQQYEKNINDKSLVSKVFQMLQPMHREVLKLRCYYDLSTKETAQRLSIKEDAVRKRYARAVAAVRKQMGDELDEI